MMKLLGNHLKWSCSIALGLLTSGVSVAGADVMTFQVQDKITMDSAEASVEITLDDEAIPGSIKITAEVMSPQADLRGIFFHISDESLISGLSVDGSDVTDWEFIANSVTNLGGGANLNGGEPINAGPFDAGIQIGTPGTGKDDIAMTMLTISHDTESLDLSLLAKQWFGIRLTSVGDLGDRSGSSKLQGITPQLIIPEPTSAAILFGLGLASIFRRSSESK